MVVLAIVLSATSGVLAAVDPAKIEFNNSGDTITGDVPLNINERADIYYNVYNANGDPIGTVNTWDYTPKDLANITSGNGGNHFVVKAVKAGKVTLTLTAKGDTKTITGSVVFDIKGVDPAKIEFNNAGDKITGDVSLNINGNAEIYYNVYDANGNPISTVNTWDYTPKDLANVTAGSGANHITVMGLKAGKVTLTLTAKGDTKTITGYVTFNIKGGSAKKTPGFELLPVLVAAALACVLLRQKKHT
jgi:hypothetical protein